MLILFKFELNSIQLLLIEFYSIAALFISILIAFYSNAVLFISISILFQFLFYFNFYSNQIPFKSNFELQFYRIKLESG